MFLPQLCMYFILFKLLSYTTSESFTGLRWEMRDRVCLGREQTLCMWYMRRYLKACSTAKLLVVLIPAVKWAKGVAGVTKQKLHWSITLDLLYKIESIWDPKANEPDILMFCSAYCGFMWIWELMVITVTLTMRPPAPPGAIHISLRWLVKPSTFMEAWLKVVEDRFLPTWHLLFIGEELRTSSVCHLREK